MIWRRLRGPLTMIGFVGRATQYAPTLSSCTAVNVPHSLLPFSRGMCLSKSERVRFCCVGCFIVIACIMM